MDFQTQVFNQPAPAVEGDFASANPRFSMDAGPGGLIAGPAGVVIGQFAWNQHGVLSSSGGVGTIGFVQREGQVGLINGFLQGSSMVIPGGLGVTAHVGGDFWDVFPLGATSGNKVYANFADGSAYSAPTGTPPTSFAGTASIAEVVLNVSAIAPNSVTASIAASIMTVSAVATGVLAPGQTVSGVNVVGTPTIVAQLTGTAGSTGTYQLSTSQTSASATVVASGGGLTVTSMTSGVLAVGQVLTGGTDPVTAGQKIVGLGTGNGGAGTYAVSISETKADVSTASVVGVGVMTVTVVTSGAVAVGDIISGADISGNATVTAPITGTGGLGTYFVNSSQTAASHAVSSVTGVETAFYVRSDCNPGEMAKISTATGGN